MISEALGRANVSRQRKATALAIGVLVCLIICISFLPLQLKMAIGVDRSYGWHIASHLLAFSLLAGLLRFGTQRWHALGAALVTISLGAVLEVFERVLYSNPVEWKDIAIDSAAACAGALVSDWLLGMAAHRAQPGRII